MKHGKLIDGKLDIMPATVEYDGRWISNPPKSVAEVLGYKPMIAQPAPRNVREGYHYERRGWRDIGKIFVTDWRLVKDAPPPPPAPRRWSRLSIKTALAQASMIAAAKDYLAAVEIEPGYTAWEALTDCNYIEEGYPNAERWNAMLDGAATALGKTREQIDAFLDAIPTEVA